MTATGQNLLNIDMGKECEDRATSLIGSGVSFV
jgi:hypothetical protein